LDGSENPDKADRSPPEKLDAPEGALFAPKTIFAPTNNAKKALSIKIAPCKLSKNIKFGAILCKT
jgi:hypothetical protein